MLTHVNRIRLLPEHVANQIAAGEVVERPASVVKELVENSLDAGTTRIIVEIGAGGRSLIRVTDDGRGMSRDDALLCLERHATSKITRAEDLASIATMGFRGEALPSIASVSRFVITTREREDTSGEATQVVVNGGKIVEVKAAASPSGTTIEVRQIFFNLPARRKFLRAEETERAHIQHYLTLVALAWPQVGFSFVTDGRQAWQLPPVPWSSDADRFTALKERLRQLHGAETPGCRSIFRPASKRHLMPELKTLGCCAIRANSRGSVCGDLSERPVSRAAHATNNTSSSINAPSRIGDSILPWLRAITQP